MGLSIGMSRCDLFLDEEDEEDDREEWGGEWASVLGEAQDEQEEGGKDIVVDLDSGVLAEVAGL